MPCDETTEDRAGEDLRRGHDDQERTGDGLAEALSADEEREAPQQREHCHPELAGEVRPEAEPGPRRGPGVAEGPSEGPDPKRRMLFAGGGAQDEEPASRHAYPTQHSN